jgi:hypothetical protein
MSTSEDVDEDVEVHEDLIIKLGTSEEGAANFQISLSSLLCSFSTYD